MQFPSLLVEVLFPHPFVLIHPSLYLLLHLCFLFCRCQVFKSSEVIEKQLAFGFLPPLIHNVDGVLHNLYAISYSLFIKAYLIPKLYLSKLIFNNDVGYFF